MPLAGAGMCAEEVGGAGWGFTVIQVLPGSLRDLVAQAAVSDHFQLGLHFAPRGPRHPEGTVVAVAAVGGIHPAKSLRWGERH